MEAPGGWLAGIADDARPSVMSRRRLYRPPWLADLPRRDENEVADDAEESSDEEDDE